MTEENKPLITFGGWFQRTTLHLSEVFAFLSEGTSKLKLDSEKLKNYHKKLNLKKITRELGYFEYISAETHDGITIRYYEDGLYIFEKRSDQIEETKEELNKYFDDIFNPAISYIFSLGAPTPKVLADIKISHVSVVALTAANPNEYEVDQKKFGEVYSKIDSGEMTVYKTINYIFIVAKEMTNTIQDLVETQIFFREFKDQLERYLYIHRSIWEEISEIKERGQIRGVEIEEMRSKLESYQKTISLINNRINQMGTYAYTRRTIAQKASVEEHLVTLFQFRFEVLFDTLEYIKHVWSMTSDYLGQALGLVYNIKNNYLNNGLSSIRSLMVLGIVGMMVGYTTSTMYPKITATGAIYLICLFVATVIIDLLVNSYYRMKTYKLKFTERQTEFK